MDGVWNGGCLCIFTSELMEEKTMQPMRTNTCRYIYRVSHSDPLDPLLLVLITDSLLQYGWIGVVLLGKSGIDGSTVLEYSPIVFSGMDHRIDLSEHLGHLEVLLITFHEHFGSLLIECTLWKRDYQ